jgi:IS1 family transposase
MHGMLPDMNKLPRQKRVEIISQLCEGMSLRAVTRTTGISINTVTALLITAGKACTDYQERRLRRLSCKRVQVDEIWAFNYCKQRSVATAKGAPDQAGDIWTWTAIDADTKLAITWLIGSRDADAAQRFTRDLASRLAARVQLTSDGAPDQDYISTSFIERQNLTMRMHMRRFTRLTNAFSKKAANHAYAVALHFMYYNFCRIHATLRMTPAMRAGVTETLWDVVDLVRMIEEWEARPETI